MSLFDFFKDAGENLDTPQSEAQEPADEKAKAAAMTSQIQMLGLEVENLSIEFDDEIVTVQGQAPSQGEKEKVILVLGSQQTITLLHNTSQCLITYFTRCSLRTFTRPCPRIHTYYLNWNE